ncbi:MAG: hypothetical protein CL878_02865 [Dehalococcoidia bacterium]|nr:hypothetical protein [Dehalococcoidia bacterium]
MRGTKNRTIRILGGLWLALGVVAFTRALLTIAQFKNDPGDFSLFWGMLVTIHVVNGWALLRRHPKARPLLAISSFVLGILYAPALFPPPGYTGAGLFVHLGNSAPLLVLVASLWLTFSRRGKEMLGSYMASANG